MTSTTRSSIPDEQVTPGQRLVLQITVEAAASTLPALDDQPAGGAWERTVKHYPVVITDDSDSLHIMWTERDGDDRVARAAFAPAWLVDDLLNGVPLDTLIDHARARGVLPPAI